MKVLLIIFALEVVFIAGLILYRKFSNKTVPSSVTESEIQQIHTEVQKEIREFEAERRRSGFQRIK